MLTLFKNVEVVRHIKSTPDYIFTNDDFFNKENNWIKIFNSQKDIHILVEDDVEYMKFVIRYYKTILENITEKELYTLYCLSLCKEYTKPLEYNIFLEHYKENKYHLSFGVKYKIYPELPLEFFISTILSGHNNEIIETKIRNMFYEYVWCLYQRYIRIRNKNISLIKKYSSNTFDDLFNDLDVADCKFIPKYFSNDMIDNIKKSLFKEDISYKLIDIVHASLDNNDLINPFRKEIEFLKENPYADILINDLNNFDFYNTFIIYYIYEMYYEKNIEALKRISLTWI